MLSVCLRATAIIAVIFFHSPSREVGDGPLADGHLRRGLDALASERSEAAALPRLWLQLPPDTRQEVASATTREAGAWLRKAAGSSPRPPGPDEARAAAGPAWRDGPLREARRVYP